MTCSCCKQPKYRLKTVQSKLLPKSTLYLCTDCFDNGYEPRHFIIIAARSFGPEATAEYVKGHKYIGKPITVSEIVK